MRLTEEEVAEEIDFMNQEALWPVWPLLPVKNLDRGELNYPKDEEVGVIVAGERPTRTVYFKNLWEFKTGTIGPQLEGVKKRTFESTEAFVRAGWVGD